MQGVPGDMCSSWQLVCSSLWKRSLSGCSHTPRGPPASCTPHPSTEDEHRGGMWNPELDLAFPNPNSTRSIRGGRSLWLHKAHLINCFTAFKTNFKYINCYIYICLSFQVLLLEGVQVVPSIKIPRQGCSGVSGLSSGQGCETWRKGLLAPIQTRQVYVLVAAFHHLHCAWCFLLSLWFNPCTTREEATSYTSISLCKLQQFIYPPLLGKSHIWQNKLVTYQIITL